jgi:hypothetical protein
MATHATLRLDALPSLDQLDPKRSPAYSRNLHRWLKEHGLLSVVPNQNCVYRVREGSTFRRHGLRAAMRTLVARPASACYGNRNGVVRFRGAVGQRFQPFHVAVVVL